VADDPIDLEAERKKRQEQAERIQQGVMSRRAKIAADAAKLHDEANEMTRWSGADDDAGA
jgi:hypothetical protein